MGKALRGCLVVAGVIFLGLIALSLLGGQGGVSGSAATIRVSGTSGLRFSGNYGSYDAGSFSQRSVDGTVPTEYQVRGTTISTVFQKQSQGNELLKVEIIRDGRVVGQAETTAAFGVASATAP